MLPVAVVVAFLFLLSVNEAIEELIAIIRQYHSCKMYFGVHTTVITQMAHKKRQVY